MEKTITPRITATDSPFLSKYNTGLGNVLFQIASVMGIADKFNIKCVLPTVVLYGNVLKEKFGFNHIDMFFSRLHPFFDTNVKFNVIIHETKERDIDENIINFCKNYEGNIIVHGYLECEKYFSDIEDTIKYLFSPPEYIRDNLRSTYINFNRPVCSVHFRGREYFGLRKKNYNYEFYNSAIRYIKAKFDQPLFLIFSDDNDSIDNFFLDSIDHIFAPQLVDYECLWLMSICDANIVSFSTFSWWGAYLNNKRYTLYDKDEIKLFNFGIPI